MLLRLKHLCKTYVGKPADVHAIRDVSIDLAEGQFVAVQGAKRMRKNDGAADSRRTAKT